MSLAPFVFSIRPQHVARILDGSKKFEYRTRRPSLKLYDLWLIYETAPVSMIVAVAEYGGGVEGPPGHVWRWTSYAGGVSFADFDEYFDGRTTAYAIKILNVRKLDEPQPLPPGLKPPQSWSRYKGEGWPT